ncbi:RNA polymerase II accessory factor [Peniophora sp. CONT]|nr:RNA polymerase II accessory factor [Peniophora sp. CONT]
MSVVDPLNALRSAVKTKFPIVPVEAYNAPAPSLREATHLRLSDTLTLQKTQPTRLRRTAASTARDPEHQPDEFFTLEAVYLAWSLRDASGAEYMKQARDLVFVGVTERKHVADWVDGKIPDFDRIVPLPGSSTTPPGSPGPQAYARQLGSSAASSAPVEPASRGAQTGEKRRHVPDAADVEAVKRIRHQQVDLRDRATVLRGPKPTSFATLRDAYAQKLKALRDPKRTNASAPTSAPTTPDPKQRAQKQRAQHPIIIISSSPTSLITMHNVRAFLEDATFTAPAEARAAAQSRPEDVIPIYRTRTAIDSAGRETSHRARYMVVDSVEALNKFGPDAWDRVVCVLTTGQGWQFRPYKWSEPRTLFHHVKGVYVAWANDPPNPRIQDWNVTELKIDPHRRHVDKSTVAHFWKMLDDWTTQHKPGLMS